MVDEITLGKESMHSYKKPISRQSNVTWYIWEFYTSGCNVCFSGGKSKNNNQSICSFIYFGHVSRICDIYTCEINWKFLCCYFQLIFITIITNNVNALYHIAISIKEFQKLSSQGIFKNKFTLYYRVLLTLRVLANIVFFPISFILNPVSSFHNSIQ